LIGTIPYSDQLITSTKVEKVEKPKQITTSVLKVTAYPNPYNDHFQLLINSSLNGVAKIEFFNLNGQKVYEMNKPIRGNRNNTVLYTGPASSTLIYKVAIGDQMATGIVINPN
jgi:hypothetical protein